MSGDVQLELWLSEYKMDALNAVEKATLLHKMDAYGQEQTGQTLADYSAQRMAEDMAARTQPTI